MSATSTSNSVPLAAKEMNNSITWRNSAQPLLPVRIDTAQAVAAPYNPFPFHAMGNDKINNGYESLARYIAQHKLVLIDGYVGVFFHEVQLHLQEALEKKGLKVKWIATDKYLQAPDAIQEMVQPFLGEEKSVWGRRCNLHLKDFFQLSALTAVQPDAHADITIVIGVGAALTGWEAPVIYFDLPKNELQYRMRAKSICNLGARSPESAFAMYKRFYFVDWVVLNNYRKEILDRLTVIADGQWHTDVNWALANDIRNAMHDLGQSVWRVRPWFEPGSWGGQWMKRRLKGLNTDVVNYAWSFELITPENGLIVESNGYLLECSFDFLMLWEHEAVLGKHAQQFGDYFPIRFDFLDTFDGGNLSIQCHPSLPYIREQFGETITQDETYYILDCGPGARVFLGFQESIQPDEFRAALEDSQANNKPVDVDKFVQSFPSHKHDLFLIPNGTVHSSGKNNLVLEISATPYIFTFKMYDWLSLDLNGQPRPINIEHAFNNLRFERKGKRVPEELISKPAVIDRGEDWELVHLPTHPDHFYDVHRVEFDSAITVQTEDRCHVCMLVEGTCIEIAMNGKTMGHYNYAETFVIPAAAKQYTIINKGAGRAKVVKAFLK